jgi:hypothetical protein
MSELVSIDTSPLVSPLAVARAAESIEGFGAASDRNNAKPVVTLATYSAARSCNVLPLRLAATRDPAQPAQMKFGDAK